MASHSIPTDHSIMKLAQAAEMHRNMHAASMAAAAVSVKEERKPVVAAAKHTYQQRHYHPEPTIAHKVSTKRKRFVYDIHSYLFSWQRLSNCFGEN